MINYGKERRSFFVSLILTQTPGVARDKSGEFGRFHGGEKPAPDGEPFPRDTAVI